MAFPYRRLSARADLYRGLSARADRLASAVALEVAMAAVARREGLSVAEIRAPRQHPGGLTPRAAAALRRQALYLAVTHFARPSRSVARVAGLSHEAVMKACRAVEDAREDRDYERMMDELELECMG